MHKPDLETQGTFSRADTEPRPVPRAS